MTFDLERVRSAFPALATTDNGTPRIYLDNPAGTQVPLSVANAMSDCLLHSNANLGGYFPTSRAADAVVQSAREAMADFLNAPSANEIIFGQNMTTMTLHLSRSIARLLKPGDEVIVSQMDHDANVWPWILMAEDRGCDIRWLPFNTATFEFDDDALDRILTDRTRLFCVGGASNLTGTINDVKSLCGKARAAGALTFVDAVQSAPHIPIDVQDLGCDFLVCSAYKFFGPHQGILWGRQAVFDTLEAYKVRPSPATTPWNFETGTQSHEGFAGTAAAVDYFAAIGASMADEYSDQWPQFNGRRRDVHAAMAMLFDYEKALAEQLIGGLSCISGVTVLGIAAKDGLHRRVPTVSFVHASKSPDTIARELAAHNIFVWNGHNYAVEVAKALNIFDTGGAVRIGPVHYNSTLEIDATLAALSDILNA